MDSPSNPPIIDERVLPRPRRVILFGAGASAFGPGVVPRNPPLGKDLYAELRRCSPDTWEGIGEDLADRFRNDFEDGMGVVWETYPLAGQERVPGVPAPFWIMQDMAAYFLQFGPDRSGSDLYTTLVAALIEQAKFDGTLLATLNYELVLDWAMHALGLPWAILKPHGAVDFWVDGTVLRGGSERVLGAGTHVIGQQVGRIPCGTVIQRMNDEGKYPAMAIYMPDKLTQVGQSLLTSQQESFKRAVETAEAVAVVGVRPYPTDDHIWGPLAACQCPLYFVGDELTFKEWRTVHRSQLPTEWIGATFEGAIEILARAL